MTLQVLKIGTSVSLNSLDNLRIEVGRAFATQISNVN